MFASRTALAASLIASALAAIPSGTVTLAPPYNYDPALQPQGRPHGTTLNLILPVNTSAYYPGTDPTFPGTQCNGPTPAECCSKGVVNCTCPINAQKRVWVYVPTGYIDGSPAPLLLMFDGPGYLNEVAFALDNLQGDPDRPLPPFVVVSVENGGSDAIGSERGLEYDTMSDKFGRFLQLEILPTVVAALRDGPFPQFSFSTDPALRATFGCSSGGAAALTAAYFHPEWFGRVVAYSATLVDQQNHRDRTGAFESFPQGAWAYHSGLQLLRARPIPSLRVFHSASEFDLGFNLTVTPVGDATPAANNTAGDPGAWVDGHHNWVAAGNRTAAALEAAGNPYRHVFALGAHHCDAAMLHSTLGDTLAWLWEGVGGGR